MLTLILPLLVTFFADNQVEDRRLRRHVETFIREAEARGVQLPEIRGLRIRFQVQSRDGAYWPQSHEITISTAYKMNPGALEAILFHELGHAWLKLPHNQERTGMMNEQVSVALFRKYRKEYIDNLFFGTPVFR